MTSEYLLDAMGLLDDDMIQDAEEGAKPAFHWQRWGAWAACLALVVALGYGASQLGAGQDGSSADTAGGIPSSSSGEAGAANSDSTATAPGENCQQGEGAILVYRDGQTYHIVRSVEKLPEEMCIRDSIFSRSFLAFRGRNKKIRSAPDMCQG